MDNSKYEAVRAKIKKTCPDAVEVVEWKGNEPYIVKDSPLRLSHILRAIDKNRKELMNASLHGGSLVVGMGEKHMVWHLVDDDLSLQSPDTIDFLFNILCE